MSTVQEIGAAIDHLAAEEQQRLFQWLQSRQGASPNHKQQISSAWLDRLARLRATVATGRTGKTTDQILDDLRTERHG